MATLIEIIIIVIADPPKRILNNLHKSPGLCWEQCKNNCMASRHDTGLTLGWSGRLGARGPVQANWCEDGIQMGCHQVLFVGNKTLFSPAWPVGSPECSKVEVTENLIHFFKGSLEMYLFAGMLPSVSIFFFFHQGWKVFQRFVYW